jgi:hypothetical protein
LQIRPLDAQVGDIPLGYVIKPIQGYAHNLSQPTAIKQRMGNRIPTRATIVTMAILAAAITPHPPESGISIIHDLPPKA